MAAPSVAGPASPWRIAIFPAAIFISAFLIFLVQPLVGKRILPWFGGSPGVWMLCLAFYQCALFLGYVYAHALIRLVAPKRQLFIHAGVLGLTLFALPVLPDQSWKPTSTNSPEFHILSMLLWNVALPFGILSASSPLIQAWFSRSQPDRSPYPLYAVSNLGSFLALLAYPFWIEPRLATSLADDFWSIGFAVAGALIVTCATVARREGPPLQTGPASTHPLQLSQIGRWGLFAGTAVAVLMGVTNKLTLDIASVPFLWVAPLALYLGTYIAAFGTERFYRRGPTIVFVAVVIVLLQFHWIFYELYEQVLLYCGLLFGVCLILHGELYRQRPGPESLTAFYLSISGGGAVAGLFVGLIAPQVFNGYYELPLSIALGWTLLLVGFRREPKSWIGPRAPRWRWNITLAATVTGFIAAGFIVESFGVRGRIHQERTFFGVLTVRELGPPRQRQLVHGTTIHGVQALEPGHRRTPTSYYGRRTPIGILLQNRAEGQETRVGVVGMGIGTLSAYGRSGDFFRFYEIDPAVVRIALNPNYFTMISSSKATIEIVEGDGRLALESELGHGTSSFFDILVLDAFNSDAIPLHLLTSEAFEIYRHALAPDGILALHISNRFLRLAAPIAKVSGSVGMTLLYAQSYDLPEDMSGFSQWVFVSPSVDRLRRLARQLRTEELRPVPEGNKPMIIRFIPKDRLKSISLWTDDFTNLLSAIPTPENFARWMAWLDGAAKTEDPEPSRREDDARAP